jgi:hypothetical protein
MFTIRQGQFLVNWSCCQGNLADYFTKHHPATHHRLMCPVYLHQAESPQPNGVVLTHTKVLNEVVSSSAAEAETDGLFHNGKEAAALRTTLKELGFPQGLPTPIQTNDNTASVIANETVK